MLRAVSGLPAGSATTYHGVHEPGLRPYAVVIESRESAIVHPVRRPLPSTSSMPPRHDLMSCSTSAACIERGNEIDSKRQGGTSTGLVTGPAILHLVGGTAGPRAGVASTRRREALLRGPSDLPLMRPRLLRSSYEGACGPPRARCNERRYDRQPTA